MHSTHWSTVLPTVSTKAYFQMISQSTEYNASYDTEYLFPVYTSVENTKQQGGSSALSLRDKCIETLKDSESTESCKVVWWYFKSSTKRRRQYAFLGAVARSDAQLMTIDQMVSKANNVPKEEALTVWGLPYKSYDSLRSHSATDISEQHSNTTAAT
jgi:hypothetical protein